MTEWQSFFLFKFKFLFLTGGEVTTTKATTEARDMSFTFFIFFFFFEFYCFFFLRTILSISLQSIARKFVNFFCLLEVLLHKTCPKLIVNLKTRNYLLFSLFRRWISYIKLLDRGIMILILKNNCHQSCSISFVLLDLRFFIFLFLFLVFFWQEFVFL